MYNTVGGDFLKTVTLKDLYTLKFSIESIASMHQAWKSGTDFPMLSHERPTNAFLYFSSGSGEYFTGVNGEKIFSAVAGNLVYIPLGSKYLIRFDRLRDTRTVLFEFRLFDEKGEEFLLGEKIDCILKDGAFLEHKLSELADTFRIAVLSPSLLYSKCYDIFHILSKNTLEAEISEKRYSVIEKSIRIIESGDDSICVEKLAEISNVSVGTFNTLFREYCGMPPGKYRSYLKLIRAKKLLANESLTVGEVAYTLGFSDVGYFCRWFGKNCGKTPLEYRNSIKK